MDSEEESLGIVPEIDPHDWDAFLQNAPQELTPFGQTPSAIPGKSFELILDDRLAIPVPQEFIEPNVSSEFISEQFNKIDTNLITTFYDNGLISLTDPTWVELIQWINSGGLL